MNRTARVLVTFLVTFLVAGGCSTHVGCGCAIHSSSVVEDGSVSTGSGSGTTSPPARPKESMAAIAAGTYVASDPVFAPDGAGTCAQETLAKVEIFAKQAPWPDRPQHIAAFSIDEDVVSCRDYQACMKSGACSPIDLRGRCRSHPGVKATLDQARAFCKWRGARLPTLLEWQSAVRGADGEHFGKCDDASSDACMSTMRSGVRVELDTSEFTSTLGCRTNRDVGSSSLHPVLASSFGHDLTGFVLRDNRDDPPDTALFRCARDESTPSSTTKDH